MCASVYVQSGDRSDCATSLLRTATPRTATPRTASRTLFSPYNGDRNHGVLENSSLTTSANHTTGYSWFNGPSIPGRGPGISRTLRRSPLLTGSRGYMLPPALVALLLLVLCSSSGSSSASRFAAALCQKGVEFFDDRQSSCQPCAECERPKIKIIPCYEYQDSQCASPEDYLQVKGVEVDQPPPPPPLTLDLDRRQPNGHNRNNNSRNRNNGQRGGRRRNKNKQKKGKNKKRNRKMSNNSWANRPDGNIWGSNDVNPHQQAGFRPWDEVFDDDYNHAGDWPVVRETIYDTLADTRHADPTHESGSHQLINTNARSDDSISSTSADSGSNSGDGSGTNDSVSVPDDYIDGTIGMDSHLPVPSPAADESLLSPLEIRELLVSGWTAAVVLCVLLLLALLAVALIILVVIQAALCARRKMGGSARGGAAKPQLVETGEDDPSSSACVLMKQLRPPAPPVEKPRQLARGLGRVPRKVHVARTYRPALNKSGGSGGLNRSTNTIITTTDTSCNNSGGSFSGASFTTESMFASFSNNNISSSSSNNNSSGGGYCKETTFSSSTMPSRLSFRNSYNNASCMSPPNYRVLYPTKEEVVAYPLEKAPPIPLLPSQTAGSAVTPEVNSVVTNNIVTFGDGSTLSTTTNFSPNLASNMSYPYSQTLPTTYIRTNPPGGGSPTIETPFGIQTFPGVPETKGSPIPYTMDRLLEQRRRLGCTSSVDTNVYVEMWRGASAGASNNTSAAPSPALRRSADAPAAAADAGPTTGLNRSTAVDRCNPAACDASSIHQRACPTSTSALRGPNCSTRLTNNSSSVPATRLANRLTAHLAATAAASSPGKTVRHFR